MTWPAHVFWVATRITHDRCVHHQRGTENHADGYALVTNADGTRETLSAALCRHEHGPKPSPGHQAAHTCGDAGCVNPAHLYWATPAENAADRMAHGTSRNAPAKPERIRKLAGWMAAVGVASQAELADRFGVTVRTIRRWKAAS